MLDDRRGRSVAAAELVRNFAHWREVGAREPVMITHHGRETHIFMGVESFRNLGVGDGPAPAPDRMRELANHIHQGLSRGILYWSCTTTLSVNLNCSELSLAMRSPQYATYASM